MKIFRLALTSALAVLASGLAAAAPPPRRMRLACRDVPTAEWSGSSLTNPQDIRAIEEIRPETPVSETEPVPQRWGARIVLRAQPGVTAEWLQRVAECHLAKLDGASGVAPTQSPLDVKGAAISIQSAGDGFDVDVTASELKSGKEILTRARALAPQSTRKREGP